MTNEQPTTLLFASSDGTEGWEDDVAAEGLDMGATVLRLPSERGPISEGVGDGAFLISVVAASRYAVRLILFLLDRLRVGLMIDCRSEVPVISRRLELRRGDILIIDSEGSRLLRSDESGALGDLDVATLLKSLRSRPEDPS